MVSLQKCFCWQKPRRQLQLASLKSAQQCLLFCHVFKGSHISQLERFQTLPTSFVQVLCRGISQFDAEHLRNQSAERHQRQQDV